MIMVAQSRELHMSDVLAHPLRTITMGTCQWRWISTETNKATLARELEKIVSPAEEILEQSATIIDGMNLIKKMKGNDKTFSQLAESVLSSALREGFRIDVVFDSLSRRLY